MCDRWSAHRPVSEAARRCKRLLVRLAQPPSLDPDFWPLIRRRLNGQAVAAAVQEPAFSLSWGNPYIDWRTDTVGALLIRQTLRVSKVRMVTPACAKLARSAAVAWPSDDPIPACNAAELSNSSSAIR